MADAQPRTITNPTQQRNFAMIALFTYIAARLAERSTYIGLIGLLSVFGVTIAPEYQEMIISGGISFASLIGVFTGDGK